MTNPPHGEPGTQHRPIGSRRRDIAQPEGFGVAPSQPPRRGIVRRFIGLIIFLAILAAMAGGAWFAWTTLTAGSDIAAGKAVKVVIPNGASAGEVADVLAESGVVANESMFRAKLRLNGDGADFRSGTYTMKTGSSYDTVVRVLEKGPAAAPTFNLALPEGTRVEETAALIEKMRDERLQQGLPPQPVFTGAQYLAAVKATPVPPQYKAPAKAPLEGFLFPATYELRLNATAQQFVDKQLAAFGDNFAQVSMANATAAKLSPYEVVTIASLIEREARIDSERPLVGAVIWNRIKIGEPLGIDASNQYAAYKADGDEFWVKELLQSQLDEEGPYNLRKVQGLPPTPIANPGLKSLQAAANPADVDYRYYVANPDGSGEHFFTESYDEFLAHPFQNG